MENSNAGVPCRFRVLRTKLAKEPGTFRATATAALEVTRYHCQYGPQDHSSQVKLVTASLLPKQTPKMLGLTTLKTRRSRRKAITVPGGAVPPDKPLKNARCKKSTPTHIVAKDSNKPRRCQGKKTAADPCRINRSSIVVEDGVTSVDLHPAPCDDTETLSKKKKPPRQRKSKAVSDLAASSAHLVDSLLVAADSNLSQCSIDLNSPLPTLEAEKRPLPISNATNTVSKVPKSKKLAPKKLAVQCKRTKNAKAASKTLSIRLLELDLNALPKDVDNELTDVLVVPVQERGNTMNLEGTEDASNNQQAMALERVAEERSKGTSREYCAVQNTNTTVDTTEMQRSGLAEPSTNSTVSGVGTILAKTTRDSMRKWGGSLKRGCLASFLVKMLYLLPHVAKICIFEAKHVNAEGVQCYGLYESRDRSAFSWHLSLEIKEFILTLLRNGYSVPQIMAKHIAVVKQAMKEGKDLSRDMFLHDRDVRNLATKVARETYMLDSEDAKSVQLWVQENRDNVFHYQETGGPIEGSLATPDIPFTIGIQTLWQREMMVQFGHEGAVSVDATFRTNEKKFPLYTLMVFDEWHNGIPVAFVLTSRSTEEDLTPWMRSLNSALQKENPNWKPNAFIVDCAQGEINSLWEVWLVTAIFLCLWHVHRAWQKQAYIKIQDIVMRADIMKGLGAIMYDHTGPVGHDATGWAIQKVQRLENSYPMATEFWDYVKGYWIPKVHMWVVGYMNLPYAGQDTNVAVENYHGYMKSVLKAERSRLTGRRVDWCIHVLTGDVLTHYWYQRVRKRFGFVDNRKEQNTVVFALLKARDIPDSDVTLPEFDGGPTYVTSTSHRHIRYVVHNPCEVWAICNCVHALKGNTCKHRVKVLRLLHPRLAEGTIARYCRALKGIVASGIPHLGTPTRSRGATSRSIALSLGRDPQLAGTP